MYEFSFNIIFSYLALKFFNMPMMAAARVIITLGINFFGVMKTTGKQLNFTVSEYYHQCCRKTLIASIVPLGFLTYFCYEINLENWNLIKFIVISTSYGLIFTIFAIYYVLEKEDILIILNKFPKLRPLFPSHKIKTT